MLEVCKVLPIPNGDNSSIDATKERTLLPNVCDLKWSARSVGL